MRQRRADGIDRRGNSSADQVLDASRAAIWQMHEFEPTRLGQGHASEMEHRSRRRRAVRRLLGIGRAPFHEVGQRPDIGRHHRADGDQKRKGTDCGDRNEVLEGIIAERLVHMREYREV